MLTIKKSARVAPEVNLRNLLHAVHKACKKGIQPGFGTEITRIQKQGYHWPHKKVLCPPNFFLKKEQKATSGATEKNSIFRLFQMFL